MDPRPIKILQWNMGSIKVHLPLLKDALCRENVDIAILQVTLYTTNNIKFNGFQQYDQYYIPGQTRGLKTLVRNSIPSKQTQTQLLWVTKLKHWQSQFT